MKINYLILTKTIALSVRVSFNLIDTYLDLLKEVININSKKICMEVRYMSKYKKKRRMSLLISIILNTLAVQSIRLISKCISKILVNLILIADNHLFSNKSGRSI